MLSGHEFQVFILPANKRPGSGSHVSCIYFSRTKGAILPSESRAIVRGELYSEEAPMRKTFDLDAMSTNALWKLYDDLRGKLIAKITDEKLALENRLRSLSKPDAASHQSNGSGLMARRPYPKVIPLYRNPADYAETWSGRGHRPRWLAAQIASGKNLEDFLIGAKPAAHTKRMLKRT
jgi:DNA-binding protein H-NS